MKNIITVFLFFLSVCNLTAQEGINFDHSTWSEALKKAKTENKLIFVDVYTSWCGPCKKMVAEVFPQKQVGDLFNASFVNCKIDAEKGEGVQVAKTYEVRSYPTYLFVNGNGDLVYRTLGYMEAAKFLQEASFALQQKNDPRPLSKWNDEYAAGNRNKDFLLGYLKKRELTKIPSSDLIEELFPLFTSGDLRNKEMITALIHYDGNLEYVPYGKFYDYVVKNHRTIDSITKDKSPALFVLEIGINNYFRKRIIKDRKEDLLPVMVKASRQLSELLQDKQATLKAKVLVMNYYSSTHNEGKLNPAVLDYVNNGLFRQDLAEIRAIDEASYKKFREPYLSGSADSTKTENWANINRIVRNRDMASYTYNLRDAAEAIYNNSKDKKILAQATEWARKANDLFPHFSNAAVYAGLLFKTGNRQKAIQIMETASQDTFLDKNNDIYKRLIGNVDQMRKDQLPESLWKAFRD